MVYERSETPNESQLARHGTSHFPLGADPVFGFGQEGQIFIFTGGVWTPTTPTPGVPAIAGPLVVYIPFGSQMANGMTYAP